MKVIKQILSILLVLLMFAGVLSAELIKVQPIGGSGGNTVRLSDGSPTGWYTTSTSTTDNLWQNQTNQLTGASFPSYTGVRLRANSDTENALDLTTTVVGIDPNKAYNIYVLYYGNNVVPAYYGVCAALQGESYKTYGPENGIAIGTGYNLYRGYLGTVSGVSQFSVNISGELYPPPQYTGIKGVRYDGVAYEENISTQKRPINISESIIENFWDPITSSLSKWSVNSTAGNSTVTQEWSWSIANWANRPSDGIVLEMSRAFDIDSSSYNKLILCCAVSANETMYMTVTTNLGDVAGTFTGTGSKHEYAVNLQSGASSIQQIKIKLSTNVNSTGAAMFYWIGLQNSTLLPYVQQMYGGFDSSWPDFLQPGSYIPQYKPYYNLLIDSNDLAALRQVHSSLNSTYGGSIFTEAAAYVQALDSPESMINKYANTYNSRYARDRDAFRQLVQMGVNASLSGLVLQDRSLMELGARYALSIASCDYWDDGFMSYFATSPWESRSFVQSLNAYDVALIMDLSGEFLTDGGRQFLMRKLAEHGLGNINFNYWKYEYIYNTNQGAYFSPARILGYTVQEKYSSITQLPRIEPYLELAYDDLCENIDLTILNDGGYPEGPMYFRTVGRDGGLGFYYYSKARNLSLTGAIPSYLQTKLSATANFAEAVSSTVSGSDIIQICDSANRTFEPLTKAMMAGLVPGGAWSRILKKTIDDRGILISQWPLFAEDFSPNYQTSVSDNVLSWKIAKDLNLSSLPSAPSIVELSDCGYIASKRVLNSNGQSEVVKLFLMGNKANAGHCHEDKGSFVLEVAGESYASDPGMSSDYSSPAGVLLKQCQYHNMLIPVVSSGRPAPSNPLPIFVKAVGSGDSTTFNYSLIAASTGQADGWEGYYSSWVRSWLSSAPGSLTIRDAFTLDPAGSATGVSFYWLTDKNVVINGLTATITGNNATITLTAPSGCSLSVEDVNSVAAGFKRIIITRAGLSKGTPYTLDFNINIGLN